jgi:hypothetical protein
MWHFAQVAFLSLANNVGPDEAEWELWHVMQLSSALSFVAATQTGCPAVGCPSIPLLRLSITSFSNVFGGTVTFPPKSENG